MPFLKQNGLRAPKNILENQNIFFDAMTSVCLTKSKYSTTIYAHIEITIAKMVHTQPRPLLSPIQMNNMQSIKLKATKKTKNRRRE